MNSTALTTTDRALPARADQPPGPSRWSTLSLLRELRRDRIGFFEGLWRQYGDVVRVPLGNETLLLVNDPHMAEHILRGNHKNYRKAPLFNRERRAGLGDSLLTSHGDHWRRQRKLCQPAFTRSALDGYVADIAEIAEDELEGWTEKGEFDVISRLTAVAIRVASKTLFGVDLKREVKRVGDAAAVIVETGSNRMAQLMRMPWWFPAPSVRRCKRALRDLDELIYDLVEQRRRKGDYGTDILSRLLLARDDDAAPMSDKALRDELLTFLIAGHESTGAALAWLAYRLGAHPEIEEKVRAEADSVLGGRRPTARDLCSLSYTSWVVQEGMRLHPPSWLFDRQAVADDVVGGYRIRKGNTILFLPYLLHRHPDYWPDPERFQPERFASEEVEARPPFAFLPFSGGPRQCIGNRFSLIELTVVLTMLLQRYRPRLASQSPPESVPAIALRPKGQLKMRFEAV